MISIWPETSRYFAIEMRSKRLAIVAGISSFLAICTLAAFYGSTSKDFETGLRILVGMQYFVLFVYGTSCTGDSITRERADRTWDFQRLTPQSSVELTLGKLVGSPALAVFISALFFLWSLLGWILIPNSWSFTGPSGFLSTQVHLASLSFFSLAFGILGSAYALGKRGGSIGRLSGAFGALLFFANLSFILTSKGPPSSGIELFGVFLSPRDVIWINGLILGGWILVAASWRVGWELLEETRPWRLPAFVTVGVWLFYASIPAVFFHGEGALAKVPREATLLTATVIYLAAFFCPIQLDDLKRTWKEKPWNLVPAWFWGWLALALNVAILLWLIPPIEPTHSWPPPFPNESPHETSLIILFLLFCLRDTVFIHWIRLEKWKQPELVALLFLAMLYFLPSLLAITLRLNGAEYFFTPFLLGRSQGPETLLPVMIQVVGLCGIVFYRTRRRLRLA